MSESAGSVIVEVEGLSKVYGEHAAVDDVSFSVQRGASLAIVGESGSGKTTIARMLAGLETPSAGSIRVCGEDRTEPASGARDRRRRGRQLQIVFQDPYSSLDPRQEIGEGLVELLRLHGAELDARERRDRAEEMAEMVGLDASHLAARPGQLSGGQRQRVTIARALVAEPEVIILDESLASLDVSLQAQILNLLSDVQGRAGVTYILISHDLAVVRQLTTDILVMRDGKALEAGRTDEVLALQRHPYTRMLCESVPRRGWRPERVLAMADPRPGESATTESEGAP